MTAWGSAAGAAKRRVNRSFHDLPSQPIMRSRSGATPSAKTQKLAQFEERAASGHIVAAKSRRRDQ
jgi:hypothetical protein